MRLSIESIAIPIARCSSKVGTKVDSSRKSDDTSSCIMVDAFVEEIVVYAKDRVKIKWKFRDEFGEVGKARKP